MSADRLPQVNQLIKKELGGIVLREIDFPEGVLVTITRVETSSNLIQAKVYVSAIPEEKLSEVFRILNKQIYFLQQKLNERLKMRPIPRIQFIEEIATREAGMVEEILEKIHAQNSKFKSQNPK